MTAWLPSIIVTASSLVVVFLIDEYLPRRPEIRWHVGNHRLTISEDFPQLQFVYAKESRKRLSVATVFLYNSGCDTLKSDDVKDFSIRSSTGNQILAVRVVATNDAKCDLAVEDRPEALSRCSVAFAFYGGSVELLFKYYTQGHVLATSVSPRRLRREMTVRLT